jgi:hypothetical protein
MVRLQPVQLLDDQSTERLAHERRAVDASFVQQPPQVLGCPPGVKNQR